MAKKKILLLSDDLRMNSGVGTMSREFVLGTLQHYDWVRAGGAIKHPDEGKIINMDESVRKETGIEDANLTIYPISGYGSQELIRELLNRENPDAILHYTDPRFWGWLYDMEHELRQNIPIFYYNIWDDWPAPHYNEFFYESCDLIMNISKQTLAIAKDKVTFGSSGDKVNLEFSGSDQYPTMNFGADQALTLKFGSDSPIYVSNYASGQGGRITGLQSVEFKSVYDQASSGYIPVGTTRISYLSDPGQAYDAKNKRCVDNTTASLKSTLHAAVNGAADFAALKAALLAALA